MRMSLSLAAAICLSSAPASNAQVPAFAVLGVDLDAAGVFTAEVPVRAGVGASYYRLIRSGAGLATDVALPVESSDRVVLRDPGAGGRSRAYYYVEEIPQSDPLDSDGDGIDDLFELQHPLLLEATDPSDASEDADGDGDSNLSEYLAETDPADISASEISFVTADGITIRGQLRRPAARPGSELPAVILIHQGFRDRHEWDSFLPAFSEAGYVTLAYDIRGHGGSGGSFSSADFDNPNTSPKDVVAALAYLDTLAGTDTARIGIVGSSVGGNLACVASQKRWVKTAVNISGKTSAVRNLAAESNLDLLSMFHIASSGDGGGQRAVWANELYGFTSGGRQVEVVGGSSAHGVAVITADPTLLDRIIGWLHETL